MNYKYFVCLFVIFVIGIVEASSKVKDDDWKAKLGNYADTVQKETLKLGKKGMQSAEQYGSITWKHTKYFGKIASKKAFEYGSMAKSKGVVYGSLALKFIGEHALVGASKGWSELARFSRYLGGRCQVLFSWIKSKVSEKGEKVKEYVQDRKKSSDSIHHSDEL